MNIKTTFLLFIAVVIVGGVLWWSSISTDRTTVTDTSKDATIKTVFGENNKPKDTDRLQLSLRTGNEFEFTKSDKGWDMKKPTTAPATESEVTGVLNAVVDMKYARKYGPKDTGRPQANTTGFENPYARVKLYKGDASQAEVVVGSKLPTGRGSYVQVVGSEDIYESQDDLVSILNKKADRYRDKRVLNFELNDVQRISVEGRQNFVLVKQGAEWAIEEPLRGAADTPRAKRVVQPLTNLAAQEWVDDNPASLKSYGLEPPRLKVTAEISKEVPPKAQPGAPNTQPADTQPSMETKTYTLLVGGPVDREYKNYFAKIDGEPWVFTISEYTYKEIAAPRIELCNRTIAPMDIGKCRKVSIGTPTDSATLTKPMESWVYEDGTNADTPAVEEMLRAVQNLKAEDYPDPNTQLSFIDWSQPRAKIGVYQEGRVNPVTILVGSATESGKMVYVKNAADDMVAVVREDAVSQLIQSPVSYRDRSMLRVNRERTDRLVIERKGSPTVELSKEAGTWKMKTPATGPADSEAVRNLMQDLSALQAKRMVTETDAIKQALADPEVTVVAYTPAPEPPPSTQPATSQPVETAATTKPATSKPSTQELLDYTRSLPDANPKAIELLEEQLAKEKAAAASQPAVATAPAVATKPATIVNKVTLARLNGVLYARIPGVASTYELDPKVYEDATAEMHDRQLARFEVANVMELAFDTAVAKMSFRLSGEDWKYVQDEFVPIDKQKITDVLNTIREMKASRYVTYSATDLAPYGLDKEYDKLTIGLKDGQQIELKVARKSVEGDADKSRPVSVVGNNGVMLIKADQAMKFEQKLEDFQKGSGTPKTAAPTEGPSDMPNNVPNM